MAVVFRNVKYRAVDYSWEVSVRHRLLKNSLMLPVPIQLGENTYPHSGHLQKNYRTPWTQGNLRSTCRFEATEPVLDILRAQLCSFDPLERFVVCVSELDEVVPSSNPASQEWVAPEEALWLNQGEQTATDSAWRDTFSPVDVNSTYFSYQDLFLPDEMIMTDPLKQFRSWLPSLMTLVQRLKTLTVSDPLLQYSRDFLSDRGCEPYSVLSDEPAGSLAAHSHVEEFTKERVLTAESLMLPVEIEPAVVQKRDSAFYSNGLRGSLNIVPEPVEDQSSLLDTLKKISPPGELGLVETFEVPLFVSDITSMAASPVPYKSYVELETDPLLSPPVRTVLPELCLSTSQFQAEPTSPISSRVLLSDRDREVMERDVWMAEKHPQCIARFLLAEPHGSGVSIRRQRLPELLSLLGVEREIQNTDPLRNPQKPSDFNLLPQNPTQWTLVEPMTVDRQPALEFGENTTEKFSTLSIVQMDELLLNSADSAVQAVPSTVSEPSVPNKVTVTSVPSRVQAGKVVKFILLEEASQQQNTLSEKRPDQRDTADPAAANKDLPKETQSDGLSNTSSSTDHQMNLGENTADKGDRVVKTVANLTTHRPSEDTHTSTPSKPPNDPDPPEDMEVAQSGPAEPKLENSLLSTASDPPEQSVQKQDKGASRPTALKTRSISDTEPPEYLDPLSSFVMLRTLHRSQVMEEPHHIPLCSAGSPQKSDSPQKSVEKPTSALDTIEAPEKPKNGQAKLPIEEKAFSRTIYVQATESETYAYWELHAAALPSLSRLRESDPSDRCGNDFGRLTSEHIRFSLKQQEKLLSMGQVKENVYNDMAVLHVLVTAKEMLLRCDLNTAIDYLAQTRSTCMMDGLEELLRRLQVLHYLSCRTEEDPRSRVRHLREQINTYLQENTSIMVLVVTATERVKAELVTALSQVPGSFVDAALPDEGRSKVGNRNIDRRSVVVCSQQIGADFSWQRFSVVLEFDSSCHSPIHSLCSQNNINYVCFCTATPDTDPAVSPQAYLDYVPFLLFITEGLLKQSELLQLLESTYNMTLLERSYGQSLERLGATDWYDIITVDEKTVIFLQELEELQLDRAAERVVVRLSALSLQFSRCWILLHFTEQHSTLVYGDVFSNLVLIYSAFVLFGLKSEDLDVKVFLVCDVADIARCVYQICLRTLLNSERSVCSWLDRDWFSVLPTEEEKCLVCFPCVNSVVAQLMLRRAPSLQWLLEASLSDLKNMFPEIPHKVCKLFNDTTAAYRLSDAPRLSEFESAAPVQSRDTLHPRLYPHPRWAVDRDEPHSDSSSSHTPTQRLFTHTPTELHSPAFVHRQGVDGDGWFGAECETSVDHMEWPGEDSQSDGYTGVSGTGEEHCMVESPPYPKLSFAHTQSPSTESPVSDSWVQFGQGSLVEGMKTPPLQPWRSSVCGTSSRGQQSNMYSLSHLQQRGIERTRPARDGSVNPVFSQRGKLLFEKIPGRCDGQTRLRFF